MENLIHIVGEELDDWEDDSDGKRYSILTQHMMLAEKVHKHEHLVPRTLKQVDEDKLFCSATSKQSAVEKAAGQTTSEADSTVYQITRTSTNLTNFGRPKTGGGRMRQEDQSPSGEWSWRPSIPRRTSSMNTRRREGNGSCRPELAAFHRRSCQLFSSLDSTLSNAMSTESDSSRTSTGTPPSLAASVTTQATSNLDENWCPAPTFPSFHLELQDPCVQARVRSIPTSDLVGTSQHDNYTAPLGSPRSSSQLSPHIVSTEQVFWTSETSRQVEYAKIEAAHGGVKGFVKRLLPRGWTWAHGKRRNFYQQLPTVVDGDNTATSDDTSVRRYRISNASETLEAIEVAESQAATRAQTPEPQAALKQPRVDLESGHVGMKVHKTSPVSKLFSNVLRRDTRH